MKSIRRQLFEHPGVSGSEVYAHDLIVKELSALHPAALYDHVGGFGVVACFGTNLKTPSVAFRADIDALPYGHRCGHDGHTAILIDFARHISKLQFIDRQVVLIFQPEEETGKGAAKIVSSGILQKHNVGAVFGLHNLPGFPLGTVVLNSHTFAAASSGVIYTFQGRSTHASTPEKGLNPGLAIANTILRLSRLNTDPDDVVGFRQSTLICCRIGEEAFGTSAGRGDVMFTFRANSNEVMDSLMNEADSIVLEEANNAGLQVQKSIREPFHATENNPDIVRKLENILKPEYDVCYAKHPFRWSEDFAEYLLSFPGAFFGIGSGVDHHELHHPDYEFPDNLIPLASHCFELILENSEQ